MGCGRRPRLKHVVFVVLLLVCALAAVEVVSRVAWTVERDIHVLRGTWWVFAPDVGWYRRPNYSGIVYGAYRSFDENGFMHSGGSLSRLLREIPGNKIKAVLLGDSCTFGNGVPIEATYGEVLKEMIPNCITINLAVPGYTSYQGLKMLRKYIDDVQPQWVCIAFNYNDRRYVESMIWTDGQRFENDLMTRLSLHFFSYCYFASGLRRLVKHMDTCDVSTLHARVSPEQYRSNLIRMKELALKKGARPVFVVMSDNPLRAKRLTRGIDLIERNQLNAAIQQLKTLTVDVDPIYWALAKKYLALAFRKKELHRKASRAGRIKPSEFLDGGEPIFLDSEYIKIFKQVGSNSDGTLIDAAAALNRSPSCFYNDMCHFNRAGHRIVAGLIAEAIKSAPSRPEPNSVASWTDCGPEALTDFR